MLRYGGAGGFQVELRLAGTLTAAQQNVVAAAVERWSKIVTGPETPAHEFKGSVFHGLVLNVRAGFDKKGGRLATTESLESWESGPLEGLPRVAKITFDTADLADLESRGQLLDAAIHEVGHALGIGVGWRHRGLVEKESSGTLAFRGTASMEAYGRLRGVGTPLPVPIDPGSGKGDEHWQEKTFASELMTPTLNKGTQPISQLTVASLKDLGFQVNPQGADGFKLP